MIIVYLFLQQDEVTIANRKKKERNKKKENRQKHTHIVGILTLWNFKVLSFLWFVHMWCVRCSCIISHSTYCPTACCPTVRKPINSTFHHRKALVTENNRANQTEQHCVKKERKKERQFDNPVSWGKKIETAATRLSRRRVATLSND